jgi:methylenetetrahydrofolate dehydrogenase (NADP+)/methenyltetrahydrofolate cyclohydrolase
MHQIINGKETAAQIRSEIKQEVNHIKSQGGKVPHLAAFLVGSDGASETYVNFKVKDCHEIGFDSTLRRFEDTVSEEELLKQIDTINTDDSIDGLIVQLPLPQHINVEKVINRIKVEKDVDGFHPINIGRMTKGLPAYIPATPWGIMELLKRHEIETSGKHCVVIGRSDIVGTPISILMSRKAQPGNATVTLCHSRTKDLGYFTKQADIIIAALGKPEFLTAEMVEEGCVVIDVGTTRVPDTSKKSGFALKGDVRYDEVASKASYITPVPGGVGPMTRAGLLFNTLQSAKRAIYN